MYVAGKKPFCLCLDKIDHEMLLYKQWTLQLICYKFVSLHITKYMKTFDPALLVHEYSIWKEFTYKTRI